MKWIIIFGCIGLLGMWELTYIFYRLMLLQGVILSSAGKMKTGNDLGEQIEKTIKQKSPNYFQFYLNLSKRYGKYNEKENQKKKDIL